MLSRPGACALALLAPLAAQDAKAALEQVLAKLDARFSAADADGYAAEFDPQHARAVARMRERLEVVFASGARFARRSTGTVYERHGDLVVGRVDATIRVERAGGPLELQEPSLLVVRLGDPPRPVLELRIDAKAWKKHVENGVFTCPGCNYRVGVRDGWVVAPLDPESTDCMEAIAFFSLDSDLMVEMSACVTPAPRAAAAVLGGLTGNRAPAAPWQPEPPIRSSDGATVRLHQPDGTEVALHALARGRLLWLLAATGSSAAWQDSGRDAQALIASLQMLDPDLDPEVSARRAASAHGGKIEFDGHRVICPEPPVTLDPPEGWEPSMRPGPHRFRIDFRCPQQDELRFSAHAPLLGLPSWCEESADAMVRSLLAEPAAELRADSGWQPDDRLGAGWLVRRLELAPEPGGPPLRHLEVRWRGGQLLVLDGRAGERERLQRIRDAIGTLAPRN
jgi:hypothetical protein